MLRLPLIEALTDGLRKRAAVETIIGERHVSTVAATGCFDCAPAGAEQVALDGWSLRARQRLEAMRPAARRLAKGAGLSGLLRAGRPRPHSTGSSTVRALMVMESLGALAASLWPVLEEVERRGEIDVRVVTGSLRVARRLSRKPVDFACVQGYLGPLAGRRARRSAGALGARLHGAAEAHAARGVVGVAEIWDTAGPILRQLLHTSLPEHAMYAEAVDRAIARERPDVIVTASAAHPLGYAFAALAKRAGVPTVEITHGIPIMEYAYLPVRTDRVAVWGPAMRDWYVERGAEPARIAITGQPRFDGIRDARPADGGTALRSRLGVPPAAGIVTLATNPVSDQENARLLRAVLGAMRGFSEHHLVVKMHPAERGDIQRRVLAEEGAAASLVQDTGLYELIAISDVVLTYHSTVGLEAMILDRPVVVINLSGLPDPAPYVERGAAVGACSETELGEALRWVLAPSAHADRLAQARARFVADYAGEADGRAASRVVDLMQEISRAGSRRGDDPKGESDHAH
jgi:hypothetical protein